MCSSDLVVPWHDAMSTSSLVSDFVVRLHGRPAALVMTMLILGIAMASLCSNLLGMSRVPYAAAVDGRFFRPFARVHASDAFPTFSVVFVGATSALCCLLELDTLINALTVLSLLVGALPVVAAGAALGGARPDIARPFRMWLFPLPALVAAAGWIFIISTSGWMYVASSFGVAALGIAAYWWREGT